MGRMQVGATIEDVVRTRLFVRNMQRDGECISKAHGEVGGWVRRCIYDWARCGPCCAVYVLLWHAKCHPRRCPPICHACLLPLRLPGCPPLSPSVRCGCWGT
jgi:hypothetical protein